MRSFPFFREHPEKHEWIGGRYTFPVELQEGKEFFRPECILWIEMPGLTLVGSTVSDPREPATFTESIEDAMLRPIEGPPRRPALIRVSDEGTAKELRRSFHSIPIFVAPVPELDAAFAELSARAEREANPSYFERGAISPAIVGEFFEAANLLFRAAPWRQITEEKVVSVDIPAFDIQDACLSVIGNAGQELGLLLFRSINDFWSFKLRLAADNEDEDGDGVAIRSLSFDRKKNLPPPLVREIREHRWPVAGAKAYPLFLCLDAATDRLAPSERDFQIMTGCTRAFLSFLERHGDVFESDDPEPIVFTSDEITLTAPYPGMKSFVDGLIDLEGDAGLDDDPFEEPQIVIDRSVGRNDPCPCGSGKKYKKCHLDADSV
jgi:hypothetical protein